MKKQLFQAFLIAILVAMVSCAQQRKLPEVVIVAPSAGTEITEPSDIDFKRHIAPILQRCTPCHCEPSSVTEISFQTRESLVAEYSGRRVLIPGDPERSSLFLVTVLPEYFVEAMPPEGHRLEDDDVWKLHNWIFQGAPWPEGYVVPITNPGQPGQ